MADIENSTGLTSEVTSDINENFNTIKTLLNSIRAQGILNTSDVDKLLTNINTKLEKINTEEDIDLIKIFLSELKQNFEGRHEVLISKFGAIEALFSNLLKNSNELPKSTEIKELFDIVATNLSVFSREVVSQKEKLDDITLKLNTMSSDDTDKKDIIKNITLLKPDLERLNNGFDSIVISLNDNFKTIVKTISTIDKTEYLDKFSDSLSNIEMSSNTILSALQLLDKKTEQVDSVLKSVLTKDDITSTNQRINELSSQTQELTSSVTDLSDRYVKIDNLADKIDASVNIIASLKSSLEDTDDKNTKLLLEELNGLEEEVGKITSDTRFDEFKVSLEKVLSNLTEGSNTIKTNLSESLDNIQALTGLLNSLDINVNFKNVTDAVINTEAEIKSFISETSGKSAALNDANITRVLNELSTNADTLNNRLSKSQSDISDLCESNFNSILENIANLKNTVSQIDENAVSSNNAIFSNISDRLTEYENALRASLESQERSVIDTSAKLVDSFTDIKNVAGVLEYKLDSSAIEIDNAKSRYDELKTAVESVLALDFVNTVKDLRVDLYASKQEMMNSFESTNGELSEKFEKDLYGKYELLLQKLDNVEDEIKKTQISALNEVRPLLDNITSSLVDVLSYVSEAQSDNTENFDLKLNEISNTIKESNMSYVESVRDVVSVIKVQVENNLKNISEDSEKRYLELRNDFSKTTDDIKDIVNGLETNSKNNLEAITSKASENAASIKEEIKYAYSKLLEIQDLYNELKSSVQSVSDVSVEKLDGIIEAASGAREDFDSKLADLKMSFLDKITEFKKNISDEGTKRFSEINSSFDMHRKSSLDEINGLLDGIRDQITAVSSESSSLRTAALENIINNFDSLKEYTSISNNKVSESVTKNINEMIEAFNSVKAVLNKVDENVDADMTRQLSIIESNFETLVSQITILFEKSDKSLTEKINDEFSDISEKMMEIVTEKLEGYKYKIEESFDNLQEKAQFQTDYLQDRIANLNTVLKSIWDEQAEDNLKELDKISAKLKEVLQENLKMTEIDYLNFKDNINEQIEAVASNNQNLISALKGQLDDITNYINSVLDIQAQDMNAKQEDISKQFNELKTMSQEEKDLLTSVESSVAEKLGLLKSQALEISENQISAFDSAMTSFKEQLGSELKAVKSIKASIEEIVKQELKSVSGDVEKETDVVIAELTGQFENLRNSQADDVNGMINKMEELVSSQVYNNIEDLKSYLDIKTDNSILSNKLDLLSSSINSSFGDVISDVSKMLDAGAFSSAISDFRLANELLVNSAVNNMNDRIESFINENIKSINGMLEEDSRKIEDKLALFDKKFVDALTDKFEEIKLLSNKYNSSFDDINRYMGDIISKFEGVNENLSSRIDSLADTVKLSSENTGRELRGLNDCFEKLRSQISSKSFDEAFQLSINKQIGDLEDLINEQLGYIEDINELCIDNLPDVSELNLLVKGSVIESLNKIQEKLDSDEVEDSIENSLKQVKTEIISQILNVFNQISFVTEQEEILDFIQEKHDGLIDVLSRIVSSTDKISEIKNDIDTLNEKINSIISSEGDIDYIYSLQDLESDIANLRIVLNEMKEKSESKEFEELVKSTDSIYKLVESIKTDLPDRDDFSNMAEDVVSISSRTNKLLLASDESYKLLQDNLQDFKLVINDLDERTKNFSKESGMDKVDSKLNTLSNLVQAGSKTNKIFNQVFEYLAEWIDDASTQINTIADKVGSLDEIGQIRELIADMKSDDTTIATEMAEAIGSVFDKQNKKISSIETKLDKLIVTNTVNGKKKSDKSVVEDTLNKFLAAMDDKLTSQQLRIISLEDKLENVMGLLDKKETAQLTKKVGGMDRQIAKLNKSIEKIASHVVEK